MSLHTPHVVLLGDSTLDNALYTSGAPDVTSHLGSILAAPWRATRCAIDGATTRTLDRQLMALPHDATHLVLSIGGNDALGHIDLYERPVKTVGEAVGLLAAAVEQFEPAYRAALSSVMKLGKPVTVCTIYNGSFSDRAFQRFATSAVSMFNDVILRAANSTRCAMIDLRLACNRPEHFVNNIEPSGLGGEKIARAIHASLKKSYPASQL